jgi:hypothetical protein
VEHRVTDETMMFGVPQHVDPSVRAREDPGAAGSGAQFTGIGDIREVIGNVADVDAPAVDCCWPSGFRGLAAVWAEAVGVHHGHYR